MDELIKYWPVALVLLNMLVLWVQWSVNRGLVSRQDYEAGARLRDGQITDIDKRMSTLVTHGDLDEHSRDEKARYNTMERRIGGIERGISAAPTKSDLDRIHARLDDVVGGVKGTGGALAAIERQVSLLTQELLTRDKKS